MPLTGFIPAPALTPEQNDALAAYTPTPHDVVADTLMSGGPVGPLMSRAANDVGHMLSERVRVSSGAQKLSPEEANARYGIEGALSFDKPVTDSEAAFRAANKRDELFRRNVLEHNDSIGPLSAFGYSVAGSVMDPANLAISAIPVVGEGKVAATLGFAARGAAASRRAALAAGAFRGAYAGGFGGTITEGLNYGLAHGVEGRDYSLSDALAGVTAGALFGTSLGGAHGALTPVSPAKARVAAGVRQAAAEGGVSGDLMVRIAQTESGLNPQARNPRSSAAGTFQFTDGTWEAMGGGDKFDEALNARRGVQLVLDNKAALRRALGRDPTDAELYLAHQQGAGGAAALLRDPERNAVEALADMPKVSRASALQRIVNNGGREDMTAGEFAQMWSRRFDGSDAAGVPPQHWGPQSGETIDALPRVVSMLDDVAREGALAKAVDDLAADRPVSVGEWLDAETVRGGQARPMLDEAPGGFGMSFPARLGDAATAVTVRGTEIPVRYALVEARDLVTSHDADLIRRPDYPEDLQPRDRDRAGSQARLLRLEKEFNALRLMETADAESGAPIVARDGVVESGNGRTIVLARNAMAGTDLFSRYRAELEARGWDTQGMAAPILVRVREQPMTGAERVRLTREMNADTAERYSATEQAFADAGALSAEDVGAYAGGELTAVKNDALTRRFLAKAGAGQENNLVDPRTRRLSQHGVERMQAAMLARAFGDRDLVFNVFETSDPNIKTIGAALTEAAPAWARMREAAARGELAAGADVTDHLVSAVSIIRHARDERIRVRDLVAEWRDQAELFGGRTITAETEAFLRLFFRDAEFRTPSARDTVAAALTDLAEAAEKTSPGPDLFGDVHAFDAKAVLDQAVRRLRGDLDGGSQAGGRVGDVAEPAGGDVRPAGGQAGERPGSGLRQEPGPGPDGQGGSAGEVAPSLLDDPDLKALAADVQAAEADLFDLVKTGALSREAADAAVAVRPNENPETIAEAIRAAAFCLLEGGE